MLQILAACRGQASLVCRAVLRVALLKPPCLLQSVGTTLLAWGHEGTACHHPAVLASTLNGWEPCLQVAVYDITEGRLPDHAIGEYVDIIKAILRPAAGGYVNGESCPRLHYASSTDKLRLHPGSASAEVRMQFDGFRLLMRSLT